MCASFVTPMPENQTAVCDGVELTHHVWLSPSAALTDYEAGAIGMVLPQIVTLRELARFQTVQDVIRTADARPVPATLTKIVQIDGQAVEVMPDGTVFTHRPPVLPLKKTPPRIPSTRRRMSFSENKKALMQDFTEGRIVRQNRSFQHAHSVREPADVGLRNINMIWVGRLLGHKAVAAVSASLPIIMLMPAFLIRPGDGHDVLIAQAFGRRDTALLKENPGQFLFHLRPLLPGDIPRVPCSCVIDSWTGSTPRPRSGRWPCRT